MSDNNNVDVRLVDGLREVDSVADAVRLHVLERCGVALQVGLDDTVDDVVDVRVPLDELLRVAETVTLADDTRVAVRDPACDAEIVSVPDDDDDNVLVFEGVAECDPVGESVRDAESDSTAERVAVELSADTETSLLTDVVGVGERLMLNETAALTEYEKLEVLDTLGDFDEECVCDALPDKE